MASPAGVKKVTTADVGLVQGLLTVAKALKEFGADGLQTNSGEQQQQQQNIIAISKRNSILILSRFNLKLVHVSSGCCFPNNCASRRAVELTS